MCGVKWSFQKVESDRSVCDERKISLLSNNCVIFVHYMFRVWVFFQLNARKQLNNSNSSSPSFATCKHSETMDKGTWRTSRNDSKIIIFLNKK